MKIKALAAITKKRKSIVLYDDPSDDNQWLSDGSAVYPLLKMPCMNEYNIFTLFDIPEGKTGDYFFKQQEFPTALNFDNGDKLENKLKEEKILISKDGRTLKPFQTSKGLIFIDVQYLKPISDELELRYYERFTKGKGDVYIVIKNGMEVIAIILPFVCIDDDFVLQMEELTKMCKVALESKKKVEGIE